jgi:PPM family protein phosphatase
MRHIDKKKVPASIASATLSISSPVSKKTQKTHTTPEQPFTFARSTVASEEHPERNEDRVIADASRGLGAVFDGVGGIAGGEIASRIAAQSVHTSWKRLIQHQSGNREEQPRGRRSPSTGLVMDGASADCLTLVQSLIEEAHARVRSEGTRQLQDQYDEPSEVVAPKTTVALVVLCQKDQQDQASSYSMVYAWVGDSRVYLLSAEQRLTRLTNDDGLLTELVNAHLLADHSARHIDQATQPWQLTSTERLYFEKRNGITQALGDRLPPLVHVEQATIVPGDRLLLCTDGIHDNLTDKELEALLRQGARTTVAQHIVRAAILRSRQDPVEAMRAKPDDMSAVVVTCHR